MRPEMESSPEQEKELKLDLSFPANTELRTGPHDDSEIHHLKEDTVLPLSSSDAPGWLEVFLEEETYYLPTQAAISAVSVQLEKALEETEGIKSDTSSSTRENLEAQSLLAQIEKTTETLQEIIELFPQGGNEQEILKESILKITSRFGDLA